MLRKWKERGVAVVDSITQKIKPKFRWIDGPVTTVCLLLVMAAALLACAVAMYFVASGWGLVVMPLLALTGVVFGLVAAEHAYQSNIAPQWLARRITMLYDRYASWKAAPKQHNPDTAAVATRFVDNLSNPH